MSLLDNIQELAQDAIDAGTGIVEDLSSKASGVFDQMSNDGDANINPLGGSKTSGPACFYYPEDLKSVQADVEYSTVTGARDFAYGGENFEGFETGQVSDKPFMLFRFLERQEISDLADLPQKKPVAVVTDIGDPTGVGGTVKTEIQDRETSIWENMKHHYAKLDQEVVSDTLECKASVALYMTPGLSMSTSVGYDTKTRAIAAFLEQAGVDVSDIDAIDDVGKVVNNLPLDDQRMFIAQYGGKIGAAGIGVSAWAGTKVGNMLGNNWAGNAISGGSKFLGATGAGVALMAGEIKGDEYLRRSGFASNPNQYLAFQGVGLRSFNYSFKFLPQSETESQQVEHIIKTFRSRALPEMRPGSAIAMRAPGFVHLSMHGVEGIPNLPALVLQSVNVTYNPSSASFFKHSNHPVEVDLSISLQEVTPQQRHHINEEGM